MSSYFISTNAILAPARASVMKLQSDLARTQKELSSGRLADVGLSLGVGVAETERLRQTEAWQELIAGTNAIAANRLDAGQAALEGMKTTAQGLLEQLVGAKGAMTTVDVAVNAATVSLSSLTSELNAERAGVNLFGGDNTAQRTIAGYFSTPPSAARQSMDTAFVAAFGMTPGDPAASTISAAAMSQFLDGAFAGEFTDAAWAANWSTASTTNVKARISADEKIEIGANANETPFRKLAQAYVMMAGLSVSSLSPETAAVVVDKATALVGGAIGGLGSIQSRLGTAQQRVSFADQRLASERTILSNRITHLEQADPYATTTAINMLMTQLQASYAATARIEKLSILNYL